MLWRVTQVGVRVIVTGNAVEPMEITHSALFAPAPAEPSVASGRTASSAATAIDAAATARVAVGMDASKPVAAPSPVPPDTAGPQPAEPPTQPLNDAPAQHQVDAPKAADAASDAKPAEAPKTVDPAQVVALAKGAFNALPMRLERPHLKEQVSAFVSRTEGRLFVRQNFMPLFSLPVTIHRPAEPLCTHVFTAMEQKDSGAMRWTVVSIRGQAHSDEYEEPRSRSHRRHDGEFARPAMHSSSGPTPAAALDRLDMPKEAVDRVSQLVIPGFSLIVSDHPMSAETEKGTDFIVLTK
jgi:hypothetical protein